MPVTGQSRGPRSKLSRVSELSLLSFNRPRRPSSATQLSSTRRQPSGVCVATQRAGETVISAGLLPEQPSPAPATPARRKNQANRASGLGRLSSKIPHRRSQARAEQSQLARDTSASTQWQHPAELSCAIGSRAPAGADLGCLGLSGSASAVADAGLPLDVRHLAVGPLATALRHGAAAGAVHAEGVQKAGWRRRRSGSQQLGG